MHIYSASGINYESAVPNQVCITGHYIRGRSLRAVLEEWTMY